MDFQKKSFTAGKRTNFQQNPYNPSHHAFNNNKNNNKNECHSNIIVDKLQGCHTALRKLKVRI